MHIDLSGKRALVTASTAGIGFSIAKGLAAAGATVIINGRNDESVSSALTRLRDDLPTALVSGVAADLAGAQGPAKLIESVGEVDILVNNAGIYGTLDFFDTDDDIWGQYWDLNVMSGVRLSRALVPAMIKRGWGRVVFVASESARNIPADMIHYGVSKTAQLGLARGLAKRLAGSGVTVNSVLPGPTLSDGVSGMMQAEVDRTGKSLESVVAEFIKMHRPSSIIQRAATTEEVANMIIYVCSAQASATTGAALRVDGGVVDDIV